TSASSPQTRVPPSSAPSTSSGSSPAPLRQHHPCSGSADGCSPGPAAPRRDSHPLRLQVQVHLPQDLFPQLVFFQQVPELAHRGLVGTGSQPRSMPTNCRITTESYSVSSTAGSDRLNHCCKK